MSNANIFGINLYEAGIGDKIEEMFVEEIAGKGAVRDIHLKNTLLMICNKAGCTL